MRLEKWTGTRLCKDRFVFYCTVLYCTVVLSELCRDWNGECDSGWEMWEVKIGRTVEQHALLEIKLVFLFSLPLKHLRL